MKTNPNRKTIMACTIDNKMNEKHITKRPDHYKFNLIKFFLFNIYKFLITRLDDKFLLLDHSNQVSTHSKDLNSSQDQLEILQETTTPSAEDFSMVAFQVFSEKLY
jgi:hypothetical protein